MSLEEAERLIDKAQVTSEALKSYTEMVNENERLKGVISLYEQVLGKLVDDFGSVVPSEKVFQGMRSLVVQTRRKAESMKGVSDDDD